MKSVSIIVPVYKVEDTLPRCVESLISQTYENLEIILVDDGSPDRCGDICDSYAAKDNRIKVIHKKNGGVGSARNAGLDICSGDFVMFVDSDDYIDNICVSDCINAIDDNINIVYFDAIDEYQDGRKKYPTEKHQKDDSVVFKIDNSYNVNNKYQHCVSWGALYRASVVRDLRFDTSLYVGEDTLFFYSAVLRCKKIKFISGSYYHYQIFDESATHGSFNDKKFTEIYAWQKVCAMFKKYPKTQKTCYAAYVSRCYDMYDKMTYANINDERTDLLKKEIHKYYRCLIMRDSTHSALTICKLCLFGALFPVAEKIRSLYRKIK